MPSKRPLSSNTVDDLLKSLLVLSRTVDHILETRAVEAAVNVALSSSKVQVLRLLGRRSGQTSSQVARFLGVSKPAVSQLIDSLERSRLVVRRTAKHDRREANLHLTREGKSWHRAIHRQQGHFVRNAVRLAKRGNATKWLEALQEVATCLAQADKAFEDFCLQCGAHEDGTCILVNGDSGCLFLEKSREDAKAKRRNGSARAAKKATSTAKKTRRTAKK